MKRTKATKIVLLSSVLLICIVGCGNKFFDPTQVGRFRPTPAVNVILDSLGVAEEAPVAWEKAEDPRPSDIVAVTTDYTLRSGDVVTVSIFELFMDGATVVSSYVVTETGKISIPDVGVVQAAGLTERQLEEEIKQILSPSILKDPSVTVTLVSSQQRTFSILGDGVQAPSRYVIPRYNFRLADAIAMAGGVRQFNVSYIYVSRSLENQESVQLAEPTERTFTKPRIPELRTIGPETRGPGVEPAGVQPEITEPDRQPQLEREMLEMISPMAQRQWPASRKVVITPTELARTRGRSRPTLAEQYRLLTSGRRNFVDTGNVWRSAAEAAGQDATQGQTETPDLPEVPVKPADPEAEVAEDVEWIFKDGKWVPVQVGAPEATEPTDSTIGRVEPVESTVGRVEPPEPTVETVKEDEAGGRIEWIFQDGKWVPVQVGAPTPTKPVIKFKPDVPVTPLEEKVTTELEWDEAVQTRLIRIPADRLLAGDPRYNIVIKAGDTIHVPVDIIGEFWIMGNVNRVGPINITGRPITLKMAIAAAGGLGPLAWPKTCEVIRRIGRDKEEIVMVDLDKIASGELPDFFIKPNDMVNVGTHYSARWRAILRNAFRATYGFGFVYDRNFAYKDYYGRTYNEVWPWEWTNVF